MNTSPILITGAARSGTSMVAGILDICGAQGGNILGPTPHNKKGQFENLAIVRGIIKPYLKMQGYDPLGQNPLPDVDNLLPFDNFQQRIESTMRAQGVNLNSTWYYKGAKLCLIWPIVHKAFPKAKWVIVRRDVEGIVHSCLKAGFMQKCKGAEGWRQWVNHHLTLIEQMKKAGLDIHEVWPREFFLGDLLLINKILEYNKLKMNQDAVLDFLEPALWNGGK